jgi:hypothetical protein
LYVSFDFADAIEEWFHKTTTALACSTTEFEKSAARPPPQPPAQWSPSSVDLEAPVLLEIAWPRAAQTLSPEGLKSKRVSNERQGREKLKQSVGLIKYVARPLTTLVAGEHFFHFSLCRVPSGGLALGLLLQTIG